MFSQFQKCSSKCLSIMNQLNPKYLEFESLEDQSPWCYITFLVYPGPFRVSKAHQRALGNLVHCPRILFLVPQHDLSGSSLSCWSIDKHLAFFVSSPQSVRAHHSKFSPFKYHLPQLKNCWAMPVWLIRVGQVE